MTYIERILCAAVAIAFVAGIIIGRSGSKPSVAQSTKVEQKSEQSSAISVDDTTKDVEHKDVVTTAVKKPDGTTTVTTVDKSVISLKSKETENSTSASKSSESTQTVQYNEPDKNYSMGLSYAPSYAMEGNPYIISAFTQEIGYRLYGGLWLEASYQIGARKPTIGIRLEF
jgi:5'-3' exonuclease